ncbi:MAG: hypothetical protein CMG00_04200 [Candidatus Marinimicrobia bacterium]|nr:hypothetical protein [Candidatus Neomarinimicrobiota bacterium]|tara:strand:+ start:2531 stop:3445 length:915 start_codon:yes stop_codon:yes gene_type:complete
MKFSLKNNKVIVLCGGNSSEKEVSIKTGLAVKSAIQKKYSTELLFLNKDYTEIKKTYKDGDVIFNALHGGYGENGEIQTFFEKENLTFIGSGSSACSLAMNKEKCKKVVSSLGVKSPFSKFFENDLSVFDDFSKPFVVKPNDEGSSVGFFKVSSRKDFLAAIKFNNRKKNKILIEEYIDGVEITVPIFNGRALTGVEIKPNDKIYDYESKYTLGKTKYIIPSSIEKGVMNEVYKQSVSIFHKLKCKDYSRLDFIVSNENVIYFLEINTYPGMTQTSLFPKSASYCGINFDELIISLIDKKIKNK